MSQKMDQKSLKITLKKSSIGSTECQKATLKSLGLRRLHQEVLRKDNPPLRGQLRKVQHLIRVELSSVEQQPSGLTEAK